MELTLQAGGGGGLASKRCDTVIVTITSSVADPLHFSVDPDLDPWIHASD